METENLFLQLNYESSPFLSGDTAKELDFYRIREEIASLCASEEGKEFLLKRESLVNLETIEMLKKLGRQWFSCITSAKAFSLTPWPVTRPCFKILGIEGASLSQEELFATGLFVQSVLKVKQNISSASKELSIEQLSLLAQSIPDLSQVNTEIFSILTPDGEMKDLPQLRAIREKIASLHREIENAIKKYTTNNMLQNALQSTLPAYKADRELLAVKAEHKNEIKGIVHEVSSSGSTLYIEPEEIVRANNDLIQEEFHLHAEIKKILVETTEKISAWKNELIEAHSLMLLLDSTMAGARWAKNINGIYAQHCNLDEEPPVIFEARHPLLKEKAVPVTINFMTGKRILIITGPNTGGKTVTLKTVALFSLLNQSGFPIPASEGTRLPLFTEIFADIGDEQSIDQSLSTFSSHMKKTATMINNATSSSLCLLDEAGSGTDPQEGGAIAMATLDALIKKNAFVLVTTHHGILKNFGYTNEKCINASVEFDSDSLKPTYRLLMGVPGESHAIDIALRSGLPQEVVQQARDYISTEQADVSVLIKGLTKKHEELDELQKTQKELSYKLEEKQIKLEEKDLKLKERDTELKELEKTQAFAFLRDTRKKLENLVRQLREGEITREKTLAVKSFIQELTQETQALETKLEASKNELKEQKDQLEKAKVKFAQNGMKLSKSTEHKNSNKKTKKRISNTEALETANRYVFMKKEELEKIELKEGMEVLAGEAKRQGILIHKEKNNSWQVQFGSMKMSVPEKMIVPVIKEKPLSASIIVEVNSNETTGETERPQFELRLLGMRYEEAMKALEHQLDLCQVHNFKNFSVIHGKGSGILQQGVHNLLSHYPGIADFKFAPPEEGGSGKTYVTLK